MARRCQKRNIGMTGRLGECASQGGRKTNLFSSLLLKDGLSLLRQRLSGRIDHNHIRVLQKHRSGIQSMILSERNSLFGVD
jgi:hypothetical protein